MTATGTSPDSAAYCAVATVMFTESVAGAAVAMGTLAKFSAEDTEGMTMSASAVRTERIPVSLATGTVIEVSSATVATGVVGDGAVMLCLSRCFRTLMTTSTMTKITISMATTPEVTTVVTGSAGHKSKHR